MSTPIVTLTAYNMSQQTEEKDFDAWIDYVQEHIDEACGFEVLVDSHAFGHGPAEDTISDATDEQRETICEALERLWEQGCSDNFGEPCAESNVERARQAYLAAGGSIEHENAVLGIGSEFLPECAIDVRCGKAPTSIYYAWLTSQLGDRQGVVVVPVAVFSCDEDGNEELFGLASFRADNAEEDAATLDAWCAELSALPIGGTWSADHGPKITRVA